MSAAPAAMLRIVPMKHADANEFVRRLHRHSRPTLGAIFCVGVADDELRGVAIVGRPVARRLDDGATVEILRVATDGARNACSKLYGACRRIARELGYAKIVTYTLASEGGTSLRAAGFRPVGEVKDRQWNCASRPRTERDLIGDKIRWEQIL